MKKIALLLCLAIFCLSFTGCTSCNTNVSSNEECTEQTVRQLIEKNLDCYIAIFAMSHLPHTNEELESGFFKVEYPAFENYKALSDFVKSVYTEQKAEELLNTYPNGQGPIYKEINKTLCVNTNIKPEIENYGVTWEDNYKVEFLSNSKENCTFKLTTTEINSDGVENEYVVEGSAVFENGSFKLTDMVH